MAAAKVEMNVLVLNAGMGPADAQATLEGLKQSSKKIGTHKSPELYWNVSDEYELHLFNEKI